MDKTFQNWHSNPVGFSSTWKRDKKYAESSVQTQEITFEDKNVQSSSLLHIATQTDDNNGGGDVGANLSVEPYPPSLYAFFSKVTDIMCKCLEENLDPFASEVFKDTGEDETSDEQLEAKRLFTLRNENVLPEFGGKCVAWNCSGSQVAVGYSAFEHEGWCCHRIPLSVWNLRRSFNFNPAVPHVQMYLSSCVSAMEFHPVNPSVIAVGFHCGEIALIDLFVNESKNTTEQPSAEDDGLLGRGKVDEFKMTDLGFFVDGSGHVNEVTGIKWLQFSQAQVNELVSKNKNPSTCCLLTSGKDGYICLWSANHTTTRLYLEKKFIAWSDNISDDIRIGNRIHLRMKEIGIIGISSCKDDPLSFMCTTYGGFVFQGTLDGEIEAYTAMLELNEPDTISPETLFDPQLVLMNKHGGNPKFVDCSPFHRNIFLSGTTNGDLCIHNLLKPMKPVIDLYVETSFSGALNDAKWSWRPSMFGVAVENRIRLYDLKSGNAPVLEIVHDKTVISLSFNRTELGQIAVCDELGSIYIWQLPAVLSSHEPDELDALLKLTSFSEPSAEIVGSKTEKDDAPQTGEENESYS